MKKIFMVEDNPDHAFLIKRGIEDAECSVKQFSTGEAMVEACAKLQDQEVPDLIFLDLKLPGMDGFDVLTALRKLKAFACAPIVILSTSSRKEEIRKAYELGAQSYAVKSEDFEILTSKLNRIKEYWFRVVETVSGQKPS